MPETDLQLLVSAAHEAGRIALRYWRCDPQTWDKGGGAGPVTEADIAVDTMLREDLTAARPGYGWLSEETEDDPARLDAETVFIVDPIDGTRSFVAGQEHWSIALSVVKAGRTVAAVVYLPAKDRTFAADASGATLNGAPITVSRIAGAEGASVLATRPNMDPGHWAGGAIPPFRRHFRPSLAYRLALVAQGRFDAMLTLRPTWEWDVAAGALIAQAAGATVTDRTGRPPVFNNPAPRLDGILAAGPALHADLSTRLA